MPCGRSRQPSVMKTTTVTFVNFHTENTKKQCEMMEVYPVVDGSKFLNQVLKCAYVCDCQRFNCIVSWNGLNIYL